MSDTQPGPKGDISAGGWDDVQSKLEAVQVGVTTESLPRAAGAERITEALRQCGAISTARVCNVAALSSLKKLRSHTFRLRLEYEGPSAGAPKSIILKAGHLDGAGRPTYANRREIAFYREVASAASAQLVPRCFEAVDATGITAWHLLLEDLTDTHFIATEWPLPPTLAQCETIVQAVARFHGAWWDSPHLGTSVGVWVNAEAFDRSLRLFAEKFALFTDRFSELVTPERRDLYERLLDQAPPPIQGMVNLIGKCSRPADPRAASKRVAPLSRSPCAPSFGLLTIVLGAWLLPKHTRIIATMRTDLTPDHLLSAATRKQINELSDTVYPSLP
jgi:hypothetical protein